METERPKQIDSQVTHDPMDNEGSWLKDNDEDAKVWDGFMIKLKQLLQNNATISILDEISSIIVNF